MPGRGEAFQESSRGDEGAYAEETLWVGQGPAGNALPLQRNEAESFDEQAVVWRVFEHLGMGESRRFAFPLDVQIAADDAWGNVTPQHVATPGQRWERVSDPSGAVLQLSGAPAASAGEIELENRLATGSISARIYRDGKLLALRTDVMPYERAVFRFSPRIYIGAVSQVQEGEVMDAAFLKAINTEINLQGVRRADLVMTGDGGPDGTQFQFNLENS